MKAEEILREYIDFEDVNQSDPINILPLTIIDCMQEYTQQKKSEIDELKSIISGKTFHDETEVLKAEIDALTPKWISVNMPLDGTSIIRWHKPSKNFATVYFSKQFDERMPT